MRKHYGIQDKMLWMVGIWPYLVLGPYITEHMLKLINVITIYYGNK